MRKKKSTVSIDVLIYMAIGVIAFLVLVFIIPNLLGKGGRETCNLLTSSKDRDGDGTSDLFDKCPCDKGAEEGEECPQRFKDGYPKEEMDKCKAEIQKECERT